MYQISECKGGYWQKVKLAGGVLLLLILPFMLGGCAWIHGWFNPNQDPIAVVTATPTSGEAPLEVTFDASESFDPDGGEILSYQWHFGDGSPTAEGREVQHVFAHPGNYTVRLTIIDDEGTAGTVHISTTAIRTLETGTDLTGVATLTYGGRSFAVRTVDEQGAPISGIMATLITDGTDAIVSLVDPAGRYIPRLVGLEGPVPALARGRTVVPKNVKIPEINMREFEAATIEVYTSTKAYGIVAAYIESKVRPDFPHGGVIRLREIEEGGLAEKIKKGAAKGIDIICLALAMKYTAGKLAWVCNVSVLVGRSPEAVEIALARELRAQGFTGNCEFEVSYGIPHRASAPWAIVLVSMAPPPRQAPPPLITRPTNLQAEIISYPPGVRLTWVDRSNNELGFRIHRWTGIGEGPWIGQYPAPEWPLLATVDAGVEMFTDTEVKPGHTHRYLVRAFNDGESSLPSNVATVFLRNQRPNADFTFGVSGLTVNFNDTSDDPDNNIVSWRWGFGDGNTSEARNPTHTYSKAGTYEVTLTVTDAGGLSATATQTVTVTAPSPPDLTVTSVALSKASARVGDTLSVTFTVENRGGPVRETFQNRVFLSTTRHGGRGGQTIPLGDFPMSLAGTTPKTETVAVTIPQVPGGNWYIAVYADSITAIDESNENNNINSASISITAPPTGDRTPPTIPTNLRATAVSSTQIDLAWAASTDNVGVSGYKVYRGGTFLAQVGATSHSVTALASSTHYCFTVSAFDAEGNESGQSRQACATTPAAQQNQPPIIESLTPNPTSVQPGGQSRITVSARDPENDPLIYIWSTTGGSLSSTTGPGDKIWTAPNTPGTYTVTVRVTDNEPGRSPVSRSENVTVRDDPAPGPTPPTSRFTATPTAGPAPLSVFFDASGSSDPDGDIVSYTWSFGDGSSGSGITVNHTFNNPGTFTVRLTVTDARGASNSTTQTIRVDPPVDTTPPTVVSTNPARGDLGAPITDTITATFSEEIQAGTLSVLVIHGDGNRVSIRNVTVSGRTLTISLTSTLAYSTGYGARVEGGAVKDLAGNPNPEYLWAFITRAPQALPRPTLAAPFNGATGVSTTPTLQWNLVSGAAGYAVQVAKDSGFGTTVFQTVVQPTSVQVSPALEAGVRYHWRVATMGQGGSISSWSDVWSFTTVAPPVTPPPPPQVILSSPAHGATGVSTTPTLSWQPADRATSYQVWVSRNSAFTDLVFDQSVSSTSVVVTPALAGNTQFWWAVFGSNAAGAGPWSDGWTFTTANRPPNRPHNISPVGGATGVSLTPTLTSSAFSDPDPGNTHWKTWWDVRLDDGAHGGMGTLVWDSGWRTSDLTSTTVPAGMLAHNTRYRWRVRHMDNHGVWSEPLPVATTFTTGALRGAKFNIGDRVQVHGAPPGSVGLAVRDSPCGQVLQRKFDGATGVILEGPVFCDGHSRWRIRWSDGRVGWSAEDWLRR